MLSARANRLSTTQRASREAFSIGYDDLDRCIPLELSHPQYAYSLTVDLDLLSNKPLSVVSKLVDDSLEIVCAGSECEQALVDVAPADETSGGRYYWQYQEERSTWHRAVEHADWAMPEASRTAVRGVYWGMYLGPTLTRRLDPSGDLISECEGGSRNQTPPPRARRIADGVFFRMSDDPRELISSRWLQPGSAIEAAAWFRRRLRARGML